MDRLVYERRRMNTFTPPDTTPMERAHALGVSRISFSLEASDTELTPLCISQPLCPSGRAGPGAERCDEILRVAALGLKQRLEHTRAACAVIGLSGGLDSTLAILITAMAFDLLGRGPPGDSGGDHALLRHHRPHPLQRGDPGGRAGNQLPGR